MKSEVRDIWVRALRSGQYEQGRGYLKRNGRYCCLGVLCQLAVDAEVIPDATLDATQLSMTFGEGRLVGALPYEVMEWAGLEGSEPWIAKGARRSYALTELNDNLGLNFSEIADIIEDQPVDWDGYRRADDDEA